MMKNPSSRPNQDSASAYPMTWHKALRFLKILLAMTAVNDFAAILIDGGFTALKAVDLLLMGVLIIFLTLSFFWHAKKKGVIVFLLYGLLDLSRYYLLAVVAHFQHLYTDAMTTLLWNYTLGSIILFVPTAFYYYRRWKVME